MDFIKAVHKKLWDFIQAHSKAVLAGAYVLPYAGAAMDNKEGLVITACLTGLLYAFVYYGNKAGWNK